MTDYDFQENLCVGLIGVPYIICYFVLIVLRFIWKGFRFMTGWGGLRLILYPVAVFGRWLDKAVMTSGLDDLMDRLWEASK